MGEQTRWLLQVDVACWCVQRGSAKQYLLVWTMGQSCGALPGLLSVWPSAALGRQQSILMFWACAKLDSALGDQSRWLLQLHFACLSVPRGSAKQYLLVWTLGQSCGALPDFSSGLPPEGLCSRYRCSGGAPTWTLPSVINLGGCCI